MGWNARRSSTFQPAGATPVFLPCLLRVLLPSTRLYGASSPLFFGGLLRLYPLNFFTCFIYSLASLTVQFFCRWDNDVFILHTTRRPALL